MPLLKREKIFCGLDVGSRTIKAAVIKIKRNGELELIGTHENCTYGLKESSVNDLGELSECIHNTIYQLTKKADIKIKAVQLGISGAFVDIRETNVLIPLTEKSSKVITNQDIKSINEQVRLLGIKVDEDILHDIPQYYKIDDVNVALNPIGLYGRKLQVSSFLIIVKINNIRNLIKTVNQAGYDVSNTFFSSYAASRIILSEEEKEEGSILIDIGAKATKILFFKDKILKLLEKIPIAGDNVTQSIADQLNLPVDLAEEIKKSYAVVVNSDLYRGEEILVKRENAYMPLKRELIFQAIEPQIKVLVDSIKTRVKTPGVFDQVNKGIVMMGGGALLPGLIDRIAQETNMNVKMGQLNINSLEGQVDAANFVSAIAVAKKGYDKSMKLDVYSKDNTSIMQYIRSKAVELYQEYF